MTKLLYQLSIEKKLLAMVAILIAPTLLLLWQKISSHNAVIDTLKLQVQSVVYAQGLEDFSGAVADHGGLIALRLANDSSRLSELDRARSTAEKAIAAIDVLERDAEPALRIGESWRELSKEWQTLARQETTATDEDNFNRHAATVEKIAKLTEHQVDLFKSDVDSESAALYFADAALEKVPNAEVSVFKLRGEVFLAARMQSLSNADRSRLAARTQSMRDSIAGLQEAVARLSKLQPTTAESMRRSSSAYAAAANAFADDVDSELIQPDRPHPTAALFSRGMQAYATAGDIRGMLLPLLSLELKQRLSTARWQRNFTLFGQGAVLLIGILLARVLRQNLTIGAGAAMRSIERVAQGKIGRPIEILGNDEFWQVLATVNRLDAKLVTVVATMRSTADTVSSAAKELAAGNDDLSARTQQQAASLEETAASMEEMTATVKQNADNANQANQLVASARQQAERGGAVVHRAVTAMSEINTSSKRIADIIGVIDEIAFQTNLLALNAAVEAARAGEQGRGFAVVATEVRNLAQRSASAAKEIKDLINDSVDKVQVGSRLVQESGVTLAEIMESVKKVTGVVAEIAAASNEQSSGIEQVNRAITQMDGGTQENAAMVEQSAAVSKSIQSTTARLVDEISFFDVRQKSSSTFSVEERLPAASEMPSIGDDVQQHRPASASNPVAHAGARERRRA